MRRILVALLPSVLAAASVTATAASDAAPAPPQRRRLLQRLVQVQVVHRHGDRTPITPMKDEAYWRSNLPEAHVLEGIARGTNLRRDGGGADCQQGQNPHAAGGRGPFGQLTSLGLLQMISLGGRLREELVHSGQGQGQGGEEHQRAAESRGDKLFDADGGAGVNLHPSRIAVTSTDFPRTIQSVQGLLVGLLPDGTDQDPVEIDVRHTDRMIPDPQPRGTAEQVELEKILARRPHLASREVEMKELADRATEALRDMLGEGYGDIVFGVGEEGGGSGSGSGSGSSRPLSWSQLAEITTCLRTRGLLPGALTEADHEAISSHAAWRWFENLRHPRLARLAMHGMVASIMEALRRTAAGDVSEDEPRLRIYSAHDSTLIGLLCAFHLDQPSQWPEYASYLRTDLIEVEVDADTDTDTDTDTDAEEVDPSARKGYYVRFSLNGEVLHSSWSRTEVDGDEHPELRDLIPLDLLTEMTEMEHRDDEIAVMAASAAAAADPPDHDGI